MGGTTGTTDSTKDRGSARKTPRAIIHKQILDQAEANPAASMEAIADAVSGATTATVERVLEEYGDPAEPADDDGETGQSASAAGSADSADETVTSDDSTDETTAVGDDRPSGSGFAVTDGGAASETADAAGSADSTTETPGPTGRGADRDGEPDPIIDWSTLTEKQRETLRAIHGHPDATQAELADRLGVSSPTISQRVNSIDGFDWSDRHALVGSLFADEGEDERMPSTDDNDTDTDDDGNATDTTDEAGNATDTMDEAGNATDTTDEAGNATDTMDEAVDESPAASNDREPRQRESTADRSEHRSGGTTDEPATEQQVAELTDRIDELTQQLATVERTLEERDQEASRERAAEPSVLADPELAHKIVHACMHSDRLSEEEELRLLRDVTAAGPAPDSNSSGA